MKFPFYIGLASLGILLAGEIASAQQGSDTATRNESEAYPAVFRIEVIVFRHADGRSDRIRATEPVDFTDDIDPLLVATANEWAELGLTRLSEVGPPVAIPGRSGETTPFLETEDETIRPIPPAYAALDNLSPSVQRALTRLTDAAQYEPVVARAWTQNAPPGQSTALVRVHDETVIDVIEPEVEQRPLVLLQVLPFDPPAESPPVARNLFRLDGTLRLRQRQFLHLDLDLAWQTRAHALANRVMPQRDTARAEDAGVVDRGDGENSQQAWQLHRLQQSRIVEPGRFEYFDSSLFGVLVRIDRFEQVVPEIEIPEPEPAAADADSAQPPESAEMVEPVTNSGL